tara:strand:+ start:721 stop:1311 length:591 start_codon:yes stop_codon:yes gene_type:complete
MSHNENFDALMKTVHKWEVNDYDNLKIKTIDKYRIISLFVPQEYRDKVMQSVKNYKTLTTSNMSYLTIEAFVRLFISICKINTQPLSEYEINSKVSTGAFRRLIETTTEEIDELNEEVEKLKSKNLKGYMLESDHDKIMEKEAQNNQTLLKENKDLLMKLQEQEKYYKEKLEGQSRRHSEGNKYLNTELDKLSNKS